MKAQQKVIILKYRTLNFSKKDKVSQRKLIRIDSMICSDKYNSIETWYQGIVSS